jgi:hypothetical protein
VWDPPFLVQAKYAEAVADAGHGGWVTLEACDDMSSAARRAAFVYREIPHPGNGTPHQLRIRSARQLAAQEGEASLDAAMRSLDATADLRRRAPAG